MNRLQLTVIVLISLFPLLYAVFHERKSIAFGYLRYVVLVLTSALFLAPFAWLLCSAFKDRSVLMEYTFLPPMRLWSPAAINLGSFRTLFAGENSPGGTVYFWQYIVNSVFLASTATVVQMFFSSMGGYALAVYRFRGRGFLLGFMLSSMTIPGMILLAPVYT